MTNCKAVKSGKVNRFYYYDVYERRRNYDIVYWIEQGGKGRSLMVVILVNLRKNFYMNLLFLGGCILFICIECISGGLSLSIIIMNLLMKATNKEEGKEHLVL